MVTKLRMLLLERGMTQKQLLEIINEQAVTCVPQYQLSRIVNGKATNYHVNTLIKICRALEVTPNEILQKKDYNSLFKH
jgi:DNA-binding Xre family transcriptional regulator